MLEGPRIYNLFPLLVGPISKWREHLPRIAAMGFNSIFINPFHYPGFSGSLYAVKDYFRLNPKFIDEGKEDPNARLKSFVSQAEQFGLKVMMDLVINHTAIDSILVETHPSWFRKDSEGKIQSPSAIDPADARKVTVWGDLAEIDHFVDREEQWRFWKELIRYYAGMGFKGFRCDAAYKVPSELWVFLINETKKHYPEVEFFAETLGCRLEEVKRVSSAGFDYLFNSSKWWDFQADWCLDQYNEQRHIAPSISFPETHDTARLAEELNGHVRAIKQRYLFAAAFSAGVMMPIGYEFGFRRRLNVVNTTSCDWEEPTFDLSGYIAEVNRVKADFPILNTEGPIRRLSNPSDAYLVLLKWSEQDAGKVLMILNKDSEGFQPVRLHSFFEDLHIPLHQAVDISPEKQKIDPWSCPEYRLDPCEMKIFHIPAL